MNKTHLFYFLSFLLLVSELFLVFNYSTSSNFLRFSKQYSNLPFSSEISKQSYSHIVEQKTWNISTVMVIKNQTLYVDKSIYILNGGALVLCNTVLKMNLTSVGEYKIEVFAGGNLTLINSVITALNTANHYYIRINKDAKFYMKQSEISFAGYTTSGDFLIITPGLWINTNNVTIKDSKLVHNEYGLWLEQSNNSWIINNTITNNNQSGIYLLASSRCIITNNTIGNNSFKGIRVEQSRCNLITQNNVQDNKYGGIDIILSDNNTITNNTIISVDKEDCISIFGKDNVLENNILIGGGFFVAKNKETLISTVFRDNTVNHKPFIFIINNREKVVVNQEAGQVLIAFSRNITIQNIEISNTSTGIIAINSTALALINNDLTDNKLGIFLWMCNNSLIKSNNITDNYYGIYLKESSNNTITENIILSNQYGIFSWNSPNNTIVNNTFRDNMVDVKDNLVSGPLFDVVVLIMIASIFSAAMISILMVKIVKRSTEKTFYKKQ